MNYIPDFPAVSKRALANSRKIRDSYEAASSSQIKLERKK
jgi:hypothetical protein